MPYTHCEGIHYEDYPATANYTCPEWSHLTAKDAQHLCIEGGGAAKMVAGRHGMGHNDHIAVPESKKQRLIYIFSVLKWYIHASSHFK